MKNLIERIEELLETARNYYRNYSDRDILSETRGQIEAYQDCLNIINQYNIITTPKEINLSEIVDKLKNNYSYDDVMIFRNSTYTRIVGRIQHHLFSSTETLFDINFNNVLDKPNFNYKWLYTLWIANVEIIDDLEEE